ncbi:MAG: division plane positioning ATPase MipZ [Holosporaceae bacterium]
MAFEQNASPLMVVFGNEKGGTGKSTLAMHTIVSFLYEGLSVASIDVDGRQGTLSRYIENRASYLKLKNKACPLPQHKRLFKETTPEELQKTIDAFSDFDVIVIDTPGNDTDLSRKAHALADFLITPINDSFIDLDLLVRLEEKKDRPTLSPSTYAEMVWEQRKNKALHSSKPLEWIVVRNRLGHLFTKNKEQIDAVLQQLSKRIGFKLASGFGERVIFRELFLNGLTLLDYASLNKPLTLSHTAARQELRALMSLMPLPQGKRLAS